MTEAALVPSRAPGRAARAGAPRPGGGPAPSPIEKAAIILAAIGPETAGAVLRGLAEPDLARFARTLTGLGKVSQETLDAVIVEFLEALATGPDVAGGDKAARKLLGAVLDDRDLARLLDGEDGARRNVWERLNDAPVAAIAGFLAGEHPQTATAILSQIRPEAAASVLERLDRALAQTIVLRMGRAPTLDPSVAAAVEAAIERDFLAVLQRDLSKRRPAELIAGLMNNISSEARDGFLGYLESQDADLAQDVARTMFTFEDIPERLNPRDVALVLRDVPEDTLIVALQLGKRQQGSAYGFLLENLPRRLAERYAEDVEACPETPRKEGEAAQIEVTKSIQALARSGQIRLIDRDPGA